MEATASPLHDAVLPEFCAAGIDGLVRGAGRLGAWRPFPLGTRHESGRLCLGAGGHPARVVFSRRRFPHAEADPEPDLGHRRRSCSVCSASGAAVLVWMFVPFWAMLEGSGKHMLVTGTAFCRGLPGRFYGLGVLAMKGCWRQRYGGAVAAGGQSAPATNTCLECHSRLEGELANARAAFVDDIHARYGFACADCHGGDPPAGPGCIDEHGGGFVAARSPARRCRRCAPTATAMRN